MLSTIKNKTLTLFKLDAEFFVFIGLLTFFIYAITWGNEFLSDDIWGIRDNPSMGNFTSYLKTFHVKNITFSAIYNLAGPNPFWFHVHNTLFHLVSIYFVYALVRLIGGNTFVARITSLLFALHPIEIEGVTWISGAPYAMSTLFLLISFVLFVLIDRGKINAWWMSLSVIIYALGLEISQIIFVFPAILFFYIVLIRSITKKRLLLLTPHAVYTFVYAFRLYYQFINRIADVNPSYEQAAGLFNPLHQIPTALGTYVQLLLLPYNLTLYHEFVHYSQALYITNIAITVALLLTVLFCWRFSKLITFGLLLFLISLTPTLLPINIGWIVAERYAHFGSIGFFLALAVFIDYMIKKFNISTDRVLMGAVVLVLILSALTVKRNLDWRSQDTLWPVTVKYSPYSAYAHNNMGDYYGRKGDYQNAIRSFERARELRPRYADATHNLANIYIQGGEATKAAELYLESVEYNPTLYQAYQKLGNIAFVNGNTEQAAAYFQKSIELNPDPFLDYVALVQIYSSSNQEEKAQMVFESALENAAGNPQKQQFLQRLIQQPTP